MKRLVSSKTSKILQGCVILLLIILLSLPITLSSSHLFLDDQNTLILPPKTNEPATGKASLQAIQENSYISLYPTVSPVNTLTNNPPNPPLIEGPTTGETRTIYLFNITVTDPDEDPLVLLEVDFGDGSDVFQECGCSGAWPSGTVLGVAHQWKKRGTFVLQARVQDGHGLWSDWGTLDISLPKSTLHQPWDTFLIHRFLFTYIFYQTIKLFGPTY